MFMVICSSYYISYSVIYQVGVLVSKAILMITHTTLHVAVFALLTFLFLLSNQPVESGERELTM